MLLNEKLENDQSNFNLSQMQHKCLSQLYHNPGNSCQDTLLKTKESGVMFSGNVSRISCGGH